MNRQRPQFGKGKSSTYLPAVLRATEPPKYVMIEAELPPSPLSPVESIRSFWKIGSPKSTTFETSFKLPSDSVFNLEGLGKVTGPPTRVHWKPDEFSKHCDFPSALCTRLFSVFWRRHHCRRCGLIFCHLHSLSTIPLDQDANFHPLGTPSRVCGRCLSQWNTWIERHSSAVKENGVDISGQIKIEESTPALNIGLLPPDPITSQQISAVAGSSEIGKSVPSDWNWSTF
ncbi:FYVE-type zinc finger-containing protein C9B6.03 [Erysiphe neolycopersici]|uniref:FYVE-type zinc finger-containing protein C9B6.03 n=1 Tax=Erysiphe neolycopersici TaxID=212602 RepID=A0A420HUE7_9PEZI|nr:FYVE-type zinc finger-containing protein C9B6.03 [Erysiphe neolycopersici]